jgi:hypothetical protein
MNPTDGEIANYYATLGVKPKRFLAAMASPRSPPHAGRARFRAAQQDRRHAHADRQRPVSRAGTAEAQLRNARGASSTCCRRSTDSATPDSSILHPRIPEDRP